MPCSTTIDEHSFKHFMNEGKWYMSVDNSLVNTHDKEVMIETFDDIVSGESVDNLLEDYSCYEMDLLMEDGNPNTVNPTTLSNITPLNPNGEDKDSNEELFGQPNKTDDDVNEDIKTQDEKNQEKDILKDLGQKLNNSVSSKEKSSSFFSDKVPDRILVFSLSSTPSDKRAGLNIASTICNTILMYL